MVIVILPVGVGVRVGVAVGEEVGGRVGVIVGVSVGVLVMVGVGEIVNSYSRVITRSELMTGVRM